MDEVKILLTIPSFKGKGGVSSYYKSVLPYLLKRCNLDYIEIGSAQRKRFHFLNDQLKLRERISENQNIKLVHINPSLDFKSFIRDGLFAWQVKKKNKKLLVFFRGWNKNFEKKVDKNIMLKSFFTHTFGKADAFIVLATEFKEKLKEWGIEVPIYGETTVVDDGLIEGFNIQKKIESLLNNDFINFLFLARLEKEKGVIESIKIFEYFKSKGIKGKLTIAGDGPYREEVIHRINKSPYFKDIKYVGFVEGEKKRKILEKAHIYLFPTYYGEGLPTSVLEAICFGCFVITTDVGGLKDLWRKHKWGICVPLDMVVGSKIEGVKKIYDKFLAMRNSVLDIMCENYKYGIKKFLASTVSSRIDNIYKSLITNKNGNFKQR